MKVNGAWVGYGPGDEFPKVAEYKAFLKKKFTWVRLSPLDDSPIYDAKLTAVVSELQRRYGLPVTGITDYATQLKCGFIAPPAPKVKPVLFTIEGHMSNMWFGPCADTARILEQEGICRWQPIGYNNTVLPFDNKSGRDELRRLLSDKKLLPPGTPWGMAIFSQGGIVGTSTFLEMQKPSDPLNWRMKDWRGTLAFGNPYREKDVVAEWVSDPPRHGTQGISNVRMSQTPQWWQEVSRTGDLYAENEDNDAGEFKTAIYMAVQNQWSGDPNSLLNQLMELSSQPIVEALPLIQAITSGVMFLGNMAPHGGYDLGPCIDYMRSRLK